MRKIFAAALATTVLSGLGAWAQSSQQILMKTCNAQAGAQKLSGDARKTFMSKCLSGKPTANLTPQQQKMQSCNARAATQKLTGDARKKFMSSCLSG
jgi:psiF repeat